MSRELRWRIVTLQVVMVVLFAVGAGLAYWGANFTESQVRSQLEPQQIFMPKEARLQDTIKEINEKHTDLIPYIAALQKYEGQQVLNGDQAHVFAEAYLGMHIRDIDNGKPYSVLSTEARAEKDPALKAKKDAMVQTAFRGETLRAIMNQAWAFSIFGQIANYAAIAMALATLIVVGTLAFELFYAPKRETKTAPAANLAPSRA